MPKQFSLMIVSLDVRGTRNGGPATAVSRSWTPSRLRKLALTTRVHKVLPPTTAALTAN
jgi:hypothetical protein